MAERWILSVDGAALVLPLTNRLGVCRVLDVKTPPPANRIASAPRREGEMPANREYEPRPVTLKLVLERPTDQWADVQHDFGTAPAEAEGDGALPGFDGTVRRVDSVGNPLIPAVQDLQRHIGALMTSGSSVPGTLTRVMEGGERITFDVIAVSDDGALWDHDMWLGAASETTIEFRCLPFGRGTERLLGTASAPSAGKRVVTLDDLEVPGDVPALARLVYSGATTDQKTILFGVDQPDAASRATGVQLIANTLDLPAAVTVVSASNSISAIIRRAGTTIDAGWSRIVELRRSGVPIPLSGTYRVLARVRHVDGPAQVRLRWTSGVREGGMTINAPVTVPAVSMFGGWALADLGLVTVTGHLDGIVEVATPANEFSMDVILLIPTESSGVLQASSRVLAGEMVVRETGSGSGGLLGPAAYGGSWVEPGGGGGALWMRGGTDARRTQAAGSWRAAAIAVSSARGLVARCTPQVPIGDGSSIADFHVGICFGNFAGITALGTGATAAAGAWGVAASVARPNTASGQGYLYLYLRTVAGGAAPVTVYGGWFSAGPPLELSVSGATVEARAGGNRVAGPTPAAMPSSGVHLAIGSTGITSGGVAGTCTVSDITAWSSETPADVALAVGKSTTIATTGATRTTAANLTGPVVPLGDRPLLPASGPAGRPVRVVSGVMRGRLDDQIDEGVRGDGTPDPLTVQVYATPRYLQVPD